MRTFTYLAVLAALAFVTAGCFSTQIPSRLVCDAGVEQPCTCADGTEGTQACGSSATGFGACVCTGPDAGTDGEPCTLDGGASGMSCGGACVDVGSDDQNCGACGQVCAQNTTCGGGTCAWNGTAIQHVVLISQENHTFDSYFGRYCTAPAYSNPTCTTGPDCCERAPDLDPNGVSPIPLTDDANYGSDHDHGMSCEVCQLDDGGMDRFTAGGCANSTSTLQSFITYDCSAPENYMVASDPSLMATYWGYADRYALADRYFQPLAGGTASNDMYLAVAHYEFADNDVMPAAIAAGCTESGSPQAGTALSGRTTIADLLLNGGFTFGVYADGYQDAYDAWPGCPSPGGTCHEQYLTQACTYDPSDVPFAYYPQFTDDLAYMHDLTNFFADVNAGTLPAFSYVKYRSSANEHPEWSYVSDGELGVDAVVQAILGSSTYRDDTLVLLLWDEGGGFYDHVTPPASIERYPADAGNGLGGQPIPYGTRVPLLAIGRFARQGTVSHVELEHSSVVRFLEWNFLGPSGEGAIHATNPAARDDRVHNLGSLLDATAVGTPCPE